MAARAGELQPRPYPEAAADAGRHQLIPYRTAADVIDWSDLGRSIIDRKHPLKPKTEARIAEGIRRYVIADASPFVLGVTQTGGGWAVSPIDAPLPTQTTRQDLAVCSPVLGRVSNGDGAGKTKRFGRGASRVDDPHGTITSGGISNALVSPILAGSGGCSFAPSRPDGPYHAVMPREDTGIASPILAGAGGSAYAAKPTRADVPLNVVKCDERRAVTTGGQCGLVAPLTCDYYGNASTAHPVGQPLGTATTLDRHAAVNVVLGLTADGMAKALKVAAWLVRHLGDAVPIEAETGLAYTVIGGVRRYFVDILFRMLRALELASAMGFPPSYEWPRTRKGTIDQRAAVKMIGNAVSVRTAMALIASSLPRLLRSWRSCGRSTPATERTR